MDVTTNHEHEARLSAALAGVLSREQLRERITAAHPLITDWLDLDAQLQPNGFDLTLRDIARFAGRGTVTADNAGRSLPDLEPIPFNADGIAEVPPGPYHIVYNEVIHLPTTLMALGRPRSSLARCGVSIHTAVWDAGYEGRSTSLLVVANPLGFRVERGARVMQLVFLGLASAAREGYRGRYQGENLT